MTYQQDSEEYHYIAILRKFPRTPYIDRWEPPYEKEVARVWEASLDMCEGRLLEHSFAERLCRESIHKYVYQNVIPLAILYPRISAPHIKGMSSMSSFSNI
jgi:hypothetical protein